MSKEKSKVLCELARLFAKNDIFWVLSGSTSLALQGVEIIANDIDILTDSSTINKIDQLLLDYRIKKPEYSESEKYRSCYGIYLIDGIKIDIMADFQYLEINGRWSKIKQPIDVRFVKVENCNIPVLPLDMELEEYENGGRADTAEKIRAALEKR